MSIVTDEVGADIEAIASTSIVKDMYRELKTVVDLGRFEWDLFFTVDDDGKLILPRVSFSAMVASRYREMRKPSEPEPQDPMTVGRAVMLLKERDEIPAA